VTDGQAAPDDATTSGRARMTTRERRLEAPHRRGGASPRVVERLAVLAYRLTAWSLSVLPEGPTGALMGRLAQATYLLWPTKRRWVDRNFAHVLRVPTTDPAVRRLALRAYGRYGRYLVELMRLPSKPPDEVVKRVPELDLDEIQRLWREAPGGGGLILAVAHMGNNEAVAAAVAHHGLPINVVADDSSFPELFELLRRQRERWGVHIVAWRNLREIYRVLRQREILGLLVDWGYRSDGIPVRLFGSWTALPAGPATLAAKTGSRILPILIRQVEDGTFQVRWQEPIDLDGADPASLQRATQRLADALEATVSAAPDQWYSFKPIWPADDDEARDLERRASAMLAGRPDPGPSVA
jgi:KDO2-lipid IV(A) lauroyltransferase